jgi:hypothetical protein
LDHARFQRRRFCTSESKRKSHFHRFFARAIGVIMAYFTIRHVRQSRSE